MDKIQTIRRERLRDVIESQGGAAIVARKLQQAGPSYLGQLLAAKRPITEKTARKLEEGLGLPYRALDEEPGAGHLPFEGIDGELMTTCAYTVAKALDAAGISITATRVADMIIAVYEHSAAGGAVDAEYVTRMVTRLK
jgi:hypothetical protein